MKTSMNALYLDEESRQRSQSNGGSIGLRSLRTGIGRGSGLGLSLIVCLLIAMMSSTVVATEGGGTSKALGVDTVMSGVQPPPGLRLTTFLARYDTSHTLDSSGNDRLGLSNFDVYANAITFRFQYVWKGVEVLGAHIETRVGFSAYVDAGVLFDVGTSFGPLHRNGSASGLGDALFGPVILGWHGKRFHQMVGPEFFLPTGEFDKNQLANTSRGYYSSGPGYWFTWFPSDSIEVSGTGVYLINSKNKHTDYDSGNELSFDYGLGYALAPAWQIGASGFLYKQIADDEQHGQIVGDGNRGQAVAVGPFLRYHPNGYWGITFKWQHETAVKNKTRGERIFLQFFVKLW